MHCPLGGSAFSKRNSEILWHYKPGNYMSKQGRHTHEFQTSLSLQHVHLLLALLSIHTPMLRPQDLLAEQNRLSPAMHRALLLR